LAEDEKIKYAAEWFNTKEEKIKNSLERIALLKNVSMYNDDVLNEDLATEEYSPEAVLFNNQLNTEESKKILEALKSVFAAGYKKTMPLKYALFTAQCLSKETDNEWLVDNFTWLHEYFDNETLDYYKKNGKPPTNKEIFLRFKPGEKNPDQAVSPHFTKFMADLKAALKERNVNFSF
jgi:hypothetical protein